MIKIAVITLGCAKNQVDSEYMMGILEQNRFTITGDAGAAAVVIVNTCSFITAAKEEAIETILELTVAPKHPRIIVAGCLAQQHARELWPELPEVAAFIAPGAIGRLPQIIERVLAGERLLDVPPPVAEGGSLPRRVDGGRPYAYLKIAEGCDNRCSYCTIPAIKGAYRSRPLEDLVAEARTLAEAGVKELILVAQDTTAYGRDCYGEYRLPQLLHELARLPALEWLRILYAYPSRITPQLVETMAAEAKVVPYLDLPLQHASAPILRRMRRPADLAAVGRVIANLRRAMPAIALRSTFIVGFPGEGEEDFQILLDFLDMVQFDWVGAFKYSPEAATTAASLADQVPEEVKEERYQRLMLHQQPVTRSRNELWVGRQVQVLVEKPDAGRSFRQAPEVDGLIYLRGAGLPPGSMATVKLTRVKGIYDMMGTPVLPGNS